MLSLSPFSPYSFFFLKCTNSEQYEQYGFLDIWRKCSNVYTCFLMLHTVSALLNLV